MAPRQMPFAAFDSSQSVLILTTSRSFLLRRRDPALATRPLAGSNTRKPIIHTFSKEGAQGQTVDESRRPRPSSRQRGTGSNGDPEQILYPILTLQINHIALEADGMHGSVSDIESVIFTKSDYDAFWCNSRISDILSKIVVESSLVFIGYSLQDQSVVELLERSDQLRSLLGDGPHFAILPQDNTQLPPSVRIIEYKPIPHKDHRTSITVIEELTASRKGQVPIIYHKKQLQI